MDLPRSLIGALGWGLAAVGCGDTGPAPDASPALDAGCPLPDGRLYVTAGFAVEATGEGFDLDGDGLVDNAFGALPDDVRTDINAALAALLTSGQLQAGVLVSGWSDPPTADDEDVVMHLVHIGDADGDPANNLTGGGTFYLEQDAFDLSCDPANAAEATRLVGGVLSATRSFWVFTLGAFGALELANARVVFQLDPDFAAATGQLGAIMTACGLSAMPYPRDTTTSVIERLANDPVLSSLVHLDMDRDGDGLERVVGDGAAIIECIDGDGTSIPGPTCVCHPAIADGYSAAIDFPVVTGTLVSAR